MGVPESIRKVERPKNTVVHDSGKDTKYRYSVRERNGAKYVPGKNPQPRNGKVVGHIIDGKFVPVEPKTPPSRNTPDLLSYGSSALFKSLSEDIFDDLLQVYPPNDAIRILVMAALKIFYPSVSACRMAPRYKASYLCKFYPGAALSQSTIQKFVDRLGQDREKRRTFCQLRMDSVPADHHIIIKGTLLQDPSFPSGYLSFSVPSRKKSRNATVLYAYDLEAAELLCAQTFPADRIDADTYGSFLRENGICRGILAAEEGFSPTRIQEELNSHPDLHVLFPPKRKNVLISDNSQLQFEEFVTVLEHRISCEKAHMRGGKVLYVFRDPSAAAAEESSFLARAEASGGFDPEDYQRSRKIFGTIVLESDADLAPETVFHCYTGRREMESIFQQRKNDFCHSRPNVEDYFSELGTEFICFLSAAIECRIRRKAHEAGLLKKLTYGDLIVDLNETWRTADAPSPAKSEDDCWVLPALTPFDELEALGLSEPPPNPEPENRGRPKKNPTEPTPNHPRGRPKKTG